MENELDPAFITILLPILQLENKTHKVSAISSLLPDGVISRREGAILHMDPLSKLVHECRWISGFCLMLQVDVTEIACGVVSPDCIFWYNVA